MLTLFVTVCLVAGGPQSCREERIPVETLNQCLGIEAQERAAERFDSRKYRVTGWRCQIGRPERGA